MTYCDPDRQSRFGFDIRHTELSILLMLEFHNDCNLFSYMHTLPTVRNIFDILFEQNGRQINTFWKLLFYGWFEWVCEEDTLCPVSGGRLSRFIHKSYYTIKVEHPSKVLYTKVSIAHHMYASADYEAAQKLKLLRSKSWGGEVQQKQNSWDLGSRDISGTMPMHLSQS